MQNVLNQFQTECPISLANAERNKKNYTIRSVAVIMWWSTSAYQENDV